MVHDLDVFGFTPGPPETDPELVVHPQAPLTCPLALQLFQSVGRRYAQIVDATREVQLFELAQRRTLDVEEPSNALQSEQCFGVAAEE
jgi:hypothetical protein